MHTVIDQWLFKFLNRLIANSAFDKVMILIASPDFWIFLALYFAVVFIIVGTKEDIQKFIVLLLIIAFSDQAVASIKPLIKRPRPCNYTDVRYFDANIQKWYITAGYSRRKHSYSFPSAHSSNYFSFSIGYFLLYKEKKRLKIFMNAMAFLGALSRVYSGVHYPSDIIIGALIGICTAYLFYYSLYGINMRKIFKKLSKTCYLNDSIVSVPYVSKEVALSKSFNNRLNDGPWPEN